MGKSWDVSDCQFSHLYSKPKKTNLQTQTLPWRVNEVLHVKQLAERRWHKLLIPYFLLLSYIYIVMALWKESEFWGRSLNSEPKFR